MLIENKHWLLLATSTATYTANWKSAMRNASVIRDYLFAYDTAGKSSVAYTHFYTQRTKLSGELAHCEHGGSAAEFHEDRADRSRNSADSRD